MNQSWARSRVSDRESSSFHNDDPTSLTRFPKYSTWSSPRETRPSSHPYVETGQTSVSLNRQPYFNQKRDMKGKLDESLARLELNVDDNEGYDSGEGSMSNFGRTNTTGLDVGRSHRAPARMSPTLTSDFGNDRISGPYDTFTSSQSTNDTESSLRPYFGYGSNRSSTSLRSDTYTPHRRSAAIYSPFSTSAWETNPSQSADDGDLRPMPDEGSASMQSYNDSQTGIWPQEDSYEQRTPYTTMTDMDNDIGILPHTTQPFPLVADADAAPFLGTQSYSFRHAPSLQGSHDVERTLEPAALSYTPPLTSQYSVPHSFHPSAHGGSGFSIINDRAMNLGVPLPQQIIKVEQPLHQLQSDQSSFSHYAPNNTLEAPRLATANIDFANSPAPASSPSISAATSSSIVEYCPYPGCRAKFTGSSWKDSLRRHKNNEHEKREKPICPVCRTVFGPGRKDNLKRHILSKHPEFQLPASRSLRSRRAAHRQRRP